VGIEDIERIEEALMKVPKKDRQNTVDAIVIYLLSKIAQQDK
jgi:hypothetical protein